MPNKKITVHADGAAAGKLGASRSLSLALLAIGCLCTNVARAQDETPKVSAEEPKAAAEEPSKAPSPWLLLPTFSNSPKLGASFGALAGYVRKFDPESQVSIFGVSAQYTSTDSATAVAFARTSFDGDQHRLNVIAVGGVVKNDYDDFLGTGAPLKSEDHIRGFGARYLYRVKDDWFIGAQVLATNYQIVGQTAMDDDLIAFLGLTGFEASGIGLVGLHDSRDRTDAPTKGWLLNLNNIAYRPKAEGSDNFSVYRLDYRHFWSHGDGSVLALRQNNQWTQNAPLGAYAPVQLRGYTMGEYLGQSMSSIEVEERHRLAERWTATLFGGFACLYGGDRGGCSGSQPFPEHRRGRPVLSEACGGHRRQPRVRAGKGRQQRAALQDGIRLVETRSTFKKQHPCATVSAPARRRTPRRARTPHSACGTSRSW